MNVVQKVPPRNPPTNKVGTTPIDINYVSDRTGIDWLEAACDLVHSNEDLEGIDDFQPNDLLEDGECVGSITIYAHGGYQQMPSGSGDVEVQIGDDVITSSSDCKGNIIVNQIGDLFDGVEFCDKCTIHLNICELGQLTGLDKDIARTTGCTVTVHKGGVNCFGWNLW